MNARAFTLSAEGKPTVRTRQHRHDVLKFSTCGTRKRRFIKEKYAVWTAPLLLNLMLCTQCCCAMGRLLFIMYIWEYKSKSALDPTLDAGRQLWTGDTSFSCWIGADEQSSKCDSTGSFKWPGRLVSECDEPEKTRRGIDSPERCRRVQSVYSKASETSSVRLLFCNVFVKLRRKYDPLTKGWIRFCGELLWTKHAYSGGDRDWFWSVLFFFECKI